jgi:hypothetical protein
MACIACGRLFHWECDNGGCEDCHEKEDKELEIKAKIIGAIGAPVKNDKAVNDPYSTGRKRAATKFPIHGTNPCEWRGLKNCGGGTPIIGCIDGIQVDRHHGPIKNPLVNEVGNVHRICKKCHNRWHVINDPLYNELAYAQTEHSPELATELELLANDSWWKINK